MAKAETPKKRGRKPGFLSNLNKRNIARKATKRAAAREAKGLPPAKKRGRKPAAEKEMMAAPAKRGPGRPKKAANTATAKRGPGRPRKTGLLAAQDRRHNAAVAKKAAKRAAMREAKGMEPAKKRGRKPGATGPVLRSRRIAGKTAKHAGLFGVAGKVKGPRLKTTGEKKTGAGRPKKSKSNNAKAAKHGILFDIAGKVRGRKKLRPNSPTVPGRKRGRPAGSKDTKPRKRRGSVNGGMGNVGMMAANHGQPTKAKLSNKGGIHVVQPTSRAVKMTVHRPVSTKIGTVTSKRGKLRVG